MNTLDPAPVAVFAYKRPLHLRRCLESLAECDLAPATQLTVYSDGPEEERLRPAVERVRDVARTVGGFASATVVARERNYGLAANIIDGVSSIVDQRGRVIVLEDDIVVARQFLRYMNDALDKYDANPRVMHISGYVHNFAKKGLPDTFFSRAPNSAAWATWRRAWRHLERDPAKLCRVFSGQDVREFNLDGRYDYFSHLEANRDGRMKTWAILWQASVFRSGGLALTPRSSLVRPIGLDQTGTFAGNQWFFDVRLNDGEAPVLTDTVEEDKRAAARLGRFLANPRGPWYRRRGHDIRAAVRRARERRPFAREQRRAETRTYGRPYSGGISIVVPAPGHDRHLRRLIDTTAGRHDRLELVLVDDGSCDAAGQIISTLAHPRVKHVCVRAGDSYAQCLNQGIRAAGHAMICQWRADAVLVGSWERVFRSLDSSDAFIFAWKRAFTGSLGWRLRNATDRDLDGPIAMVYGIYRRKVFDEIGLYNTSIRGLGANGDMINRAYRFGYRVRSLPGVRVVGGGSLSRRFRSAPGDTNVVSHNKELYKRSLLPGQIECP